MKVPGSRIRLCGSTLVARLRARSFVVLSTMAAGVIAIAAFDAGRTHFLTGIILGLTLTHGIVSDDLRNGTLLLWLQKPRSPAGLYLERVAGVTVAAWAAHALVLLLGLALASGPAGAYRTLLQLPAGMALDLAAVAVAFGWSSLGLRPELIPTLLVIVVLGPLGGDAVTAPETMGRWAPFLAAQRFPFREAYMLSAWLGGAGSPPTGIASARLVLYPAVWIGVGSLILGWRARRPQSFAVEE